MGDRLVGWGCGFMLGRSSPLWLIRLLVCAVLVACGGDVVAPKVQRSESKSTSAAFLAPSPVGPSPYIPGDRDSILGRYVFDAARVDAVLNSGVPVFIYSDAIW